VLVVVPNSPDQAFDFLEGRLYAQGDEWIRLKAINIMENIKIRSRDAIFCWN
jgi:hypothetical protein